MGKVIILPDTTKNPITKIGAMAGICWGADTTDPAKNYKRGWDCIESGHGRTLEFVNVELRLVDYSARVIREWYTHIGCLPTRLQESTRYINYENFGYIMPPSIEAKAEAKNRYVTLMDAIRRTAKALEELGIPREDVANVLPLGMHTGIADKRNLRNYIDMSRNRDCARALWEYRGMFDDISRALIDYGHAHDSNEWQTVVETQFAPKCEVLGYCPEKHGCGKYPKRGERRGTAY